MFMYQSAMNRGDASELLRTAIRFSETHVKLERRALIVTVTNIYAFNLYKNSDSLSM